MYKIDAHNHPDFLKKNYAAILADMDEKGINKCCLLSWENPWVENYLFNLNSCPSPLSPNVAIPFERCLSVYEKAPDRFILGYAPDPRIPGALYKMEAAIDTYGVKICGEFKYRMMLDNPDAVDLFRYCGSRNVPVILHLDNPGAHSMPEGAQWPHSWYGGDIFTLERALQLCPDTNFLGHAPGFWACISGDDQWKTVGYPRGPVLPGGHIERLLETYPNLYCDCSAGSGFIALSRDPEYTKYLFTKYPTRFVYARDCFDNALAEYIDSLGLPEDVLELFYHGNLERLIADVK